MHRDVILPAPIVNALLIVDLFSHSVDNHARRPDGTLLSLLFMHFLNDGDHERLQLAIIHVWNNQVSDSIEALHPEGLAVKVEVPNVVRGEALHKVFLNTTSGCDDAIYHLVLTKISDVLSHSARRHVRCVSEEYGAADILSVCLDLVLVFLVFLDGLIG
jgi:hypothetical protein